MPRFLFAWTGSTQCTVFRKMVFIPASCLFSICYNVLMLYGVPYLLLGGGGGF